ncbi:cysteine dioxygenase [Frankia sp. B2]|nr:cysteine dioxygenase [Frankia sp. KB5]TFE34953.1 cysteine dioxygenase [Frankia sp. B2]
MADPIRIADPTCIADPTRSADPFVPASCLSDEPGLIDLVTLCELTAALAATPEVWRPVIRHRPDRRWYTRLLLSATVEVWLIGWYPGQQTEVHDHGGALGALTVAEGFVEEDQYDRSWTSSQVHRHGTGAVVGFDPTHIHRVANRGRQVATTIHAYSPPELSMRFAPAPADGGRAEDPRAVEIPPAAAAAATVLGPAVTIGAATAAMEAGRGDRRAPTHAVAGSGA